MSLQVENNMKILIVGSESRLIHLKHFSYELEKFGIESKVIVDTDFLEKFFSLNLKKKINTNKKLKILLNAFEPNIVLLDRISRIGKIFLDEKIPLFLLLRGNYWKESEWAKKTIYKSPLKFFSVQKNLKLADKIFKDSSMILPISEYLKNEVQMRYPKNKIEVLSADGRNASDWIQVNNQKLTHPCVGLVQGFNIWGKTRELNTLQDVMKKLPNVTFYLAGDGIYKDKIIPSLQKFRNFVWLGNLVYPKQVMEFFSEMDIFLLLSGMEGLGQTIIEAMFMQKPIIATRVGGIPELIQDGKNGFLINSGDGEGLTNQILKLINDPELANKIGKLGRKTAEENFTWKIIAEKFFAIVKKHVDLTHD